MTRAPGLEESGSTEFLFDVEALELMDEAGVFGRDNHRIELLEGKLIKMAPTGGEHGYVGGQVDRELWRVIAATERRSLCVVSATVNLGGRNAPIPDSIVVEGRSRARYYPADQALLVVEIGVSSLRNDLAGKRDAYAQAGVVEYWVVDPADQVLHRFATPRDGIYVEHEQLRPGDRVSPLFAEGRAEIAVADLFS